MFPQNEEYSFAEGERRYMAKSRSEYVVKNASITLVMQIIKNVLAFIGRTVFVYVLGAEYLGVNSLFTDILTMLSFAELGVGNAIVFSLYKPIAEGNTEKIKSLMRIYEKAYRIIGIAIAAIGVCIVPFLDAIVGDVSYVKENITLLYLLFLLNSVLSYFFAYKKSLIIAYQKNYIVDIYQQVFYAIQIAGQVAFLLITKEFIPYLIMMIVCTFLNNVYMAHKANQMYPYLKDKDVVPLEKSESKEIANNVKSLVVYKLGGIILENTDSIFISAIIDVITVGLYANYKMVVNVFKTVGAQIMNSIVASVGNLNAGDDTAKKEEVFYEMFLVCTWFYGFSAAGLFSFLTPFVKIWLGDSYIIGTGAVLAACVYFYVANMHYPAYTYRTTAGLFRYGKFVPMMCAGLNIALDVVLGMKWGLAGILWASTISRAFTYELIDPIILYRRVFHKNVLKYFAMYFAMALLMAADGVVSYLVMNLVPFSGLLGLIIKALIFTVIYNGIFLLVICRTKYFKAILNRIKNMARNRRGK